MSSDPKRVADRYVRLRGHPRSDAPIRHSHIWLFEGAEGGKWLSDFEGTEAQAAHISDGAPDVLSLPAPSAAVGDTPRDAKRARML
jgi:hypothetical protein